MNLIKPLAIALPVAVGTMLSVAVVAQAGSEFSDVSAAFAAEFNTVGEHLDATSSAFDEAIAANHEMKVIADEADTTYDTYVSAVDGITFGTADESINAAASALRSASSDYDAAVNTSDDWTSSATFSSVDFAIAEVERLRIVLHDAGISAGLAAEAADLVTQQVVNGVTQEQVDYATELADFDTPFGATEYATAEGVSAEEHEVANGASAVNVPVTAEVVAYLNDTGSGAPYVDDIGSEAAIDANVLYNESPQGLKLTAVEVAAIKAAHKANTQIAFYDDPDNNNGQEITADHITDAEAMVTAGPIVDVTDADIAKAKTLILAEPITQALIEQAKLDELRTEVTQGEIDLSVEKIEAIDSTYDKTDKTDTISVSIIEGNDSIFVTESNFDTAQNLLNDENTDWTSGQVIDTKTITKDEAQEIITAYENQLIINAGTISQQKIDAAKITALLNVDTEKEKVIKARALVEKGPINVLTQAEYDAAGKFVNEMAGVKSAVEAMEAAEAALIEAIKDSDDKAIKSASKALESATAAIKNVIKINQKVAAAISDVNDGKMSIRHFNEKIKPDAGVALSGAMSGVTVVNNTITSHQNTLVASSGKYGLTKHSGVNAGSAPLNMGVWLKAFGSDSEMDMRDSIAGYDANTHGVVIGVDQVIGNDMMVGIALSFAGTDVEGKSTAKSITDTDQIQGTLYGSLFMEDFFINGSVAYAHSSSDTERTGFGGVVTGEYDTSTYSASIGAGMPVDMESYAITPQITLAYSHVNPEDYTESGFGALNVRPESMDLFGIKAGVTINKKLIFDGGTLSPKLRLIADWDVLQEKAQVNSSWVSTGTTVTPTSGPEPAALGGIIGAGVDYTTDDGIYVFSLDYDLSTRADFVSHAASAQFRLNF